MNVKMLEATLGMVARFIPPEEYAKAVKAISELTQVATAIDNRLKDIQEFVKEQSDRMEMLESIVRSNVPGAATDFAAREMYMVPGTIEKALAPSEGGDANGG